MLYIQKNQINPPDQQDSLELQENSLPSSVFTSLKFNWILTHSSANSIRLLHRNKTAIDKQGNVPLTTRAVIIKIHICGYIELDILMITMLVLWTKDGGKTNII